MNSNLKFSRFLKIFSHKNPSTYKKQRYCKLELSYIATRQKFCVKTIYYFEDSEKEEIFRTDFTPKKRAIGFFKSRCGANLLLLRIRFVLDCAFRFLSLTGNCWSSPRKFREYPHKFIYAEEGNEQEKTPHKQTFITKHPTIPIHNYSSKKAIFGVRGCDSGIKGKDRGVEGKSRGSEGGIKASSFGLAM